MCVLHAALCWEIFLYHTFPQRGQSNYFKFFFFCFLVCFCRGQNMWVLSGVGRRGRLSDVDRERRWHAVNTCIKNCVRAALVLDKALIIWAYSHTHTHKGSVWINPPTPVNSADLIKSSCQNQITFSSLQILQPRMATNPEMWVWTSWGTEAVVVGTWQDLTKLQTTFP